MIEFIKRFLVKKNTEKISSVKNKIKSIFRLPFYLGKIHFLDTFLAYQPDSYTQFSEHKEYGTLYKSFIAHNKLNNAGDTTRLWCLILNIKQVISENIPGNFAELGVWKGNSASILAYYASLNRRKLYLFDTFQGFDSRDLKGIDKNTRVAFSDTSLDLVKKVIGQSIDCCVFVNGYFPTTISSEHENQQYAVVSLDCDLYEPMTAGLDFFYPLMPKGALFLLHDYSSNCWAGARKAIDDFCKKNDERVILMPDKSGSAIIRKAK